MKLVLILFAAGAIAAPPGMGVAEDYHKTVGIPMAERIRQQEMAIDFDGSRIVGGSPVAAGVHPFVVGLLANLGGPVSVCTATMLSNTRTLTAAHCGGANMRFYTLVFGSVFLFSGGVRVDTTEFIIHPLYGTFNYDIAVMRHGWVSYTNLIQPIALPVGFDAYAHQWAMAAGFGRTNTDAPVLNNQSLRQIWLWVMTNDECRWYAGNFLIPAMLCTSGAGGVGGCNGDSGGPLFITSGGTRTLDSENDYFNFIPMNTVVGQKNEKQLNLEGPSSKQLKRSSTAAFTCIKKLTRGAKVIRIEVYDVESYPDIISSLCNCDAELCVQHVVKNIFMDDIYKSVKEIAVKVSNNMS